MTAPRPVSLGTVADEVFDLKLAIAALTAIIASLPQAADVDPSQPREILNHLIDPKADTVPGDQIARAMFFVENTLKAARSQRA